MVELVSGRRDVALVLEAERAVPWIRGTAGSPCPGRSCEHVDDPNGTRGPKGERRVFARSGLNAIGILFLIHETRTQMRRILDFDPLVE